MICNYIDFILQNKLQDYATLLALFFKGRLPCLVDPYIVIMTVPLPFTIVQKLFDTKSSFNVKQRITVKV